MELMELIETMKGAISKAVYLSLNQMDGGLASQIRAEAGFLLNYSIGSDKKSFGSKPRLGEGSPAAAEKSTSRTVIEMNFGHVVVLGRVLHRAPYAALKPERNFIH